MDQNEARDILAGAAYKWLQELHNYVIDGEQDPEMHECYGQEARDIERALHTVRTRYGVIDRRTGANRNE